MFDRILIANRGEIALRLVRACRELGIHTIAVYSDVDQEALHVRMADEAAYLGPAPAAASYLNGGRLLDVAREHHAAAIHPGYGFLAESASFAAACEQAGITFIGPPAHVLAAIGHKTTARRTLHLAGIPIVPGSTEPVHSVEQALAEAEVIGYPLLIKAAAGGGGKGMRIVEQPQALPQLFRAASGEARSAFADPSLYVERLIQPARHVEVQLLADRHGHIIQLGERECSVQRRYQKLIEESPCPALTAQQRHRLADLALTIARQVGYQSAGTVEFLLADCGEIYFLEVNARLQVEHPVTELVTGIDLVKAQIRLAAGEPLPLQQDEVTWRGAAIECRIYAEDPFQDFAPSIGTVSYLREPAGPGVRVDSCLFPGLEVTIHYDPLVGKLIAWGTNRQEALARLERALSEYRIFGLRTTLPFHRWILGQQAFRSGTLDTQFVERQWAGQGQIDQQELQTAVVGATLFHHLRLGRGWATPSAPPARTEGSQRWKQAARQQMLRP